jgi:receptor-type tyrosine-protein phosphatase beta
VHVLIDDLVSGVEYNFQIHVISYSLVSDMASLQVRTMPLIQSEIFIVSGLDPDVKNSVTLTYTQTPQNQRIKFDHYRFSIGDPNIPEKEKLANDTNRKVTFTDLMPGRLYNIKMWTVSGGVASQPIQRQDRLHPEPINILNATKITDTEISLSWDKPQGEYTSFEVQYLVDNNYASNITNDLHITINDLKPHRNYTFTVVVRSGTELSVLRNSVPVSAVFTTEESVPGRVHKFNPIDVQPSEIVFEWSLPVAEQNGVITQFSIIYIPENGSQSTVKNFNPENLRGTIRALTPGMTYIFKIQAKTSVGYGPETIWKQKMPILAPPKPGNQVVPTEVHRSSNTIQIRFRKNYFLDSNGVVTMYTIIVAEDDSKNSSGLEMPSWHDVQSYSIWPPYQAFDPYYPFKNSSVNVEDFIIGADNCDNRQKGYCNGPLKSGTTYRVKIRAFTAPDKFTDTAYSFPIQTGKFSFCVFYQTRHDTKFSINLLHSKFSEGIRIVKGKLKSFCLVLSLLWFSF